MVFHVSLKTGCREEGDGESNSHLDVFTRVYIHTGMHSVRQ